ncbi:MAG: SAM-dependent methyltransferase [Halobacteriovorax sp.]|nr:SAM-dependent methyltransferase [Halobacteriovorax sp.]|tara:strand:+ start:138 stop:704 length:567 start_codon:yes stop_codon:yes gene_type:complete
MREFKTDTIPLPRSDVKAPQELFDLEIGCGAGLHPILYSKSNPTRTLVAIERTREKYDKFLGRFNRHGSPTSIIPVHDDAIHWVTHRVAPESINHVFILYPNPEPSNKNQRFAHMPFMAFLVTRLINSGKIELATNIESYANECLEHFPKYGLRLVDQASPTKPGRTHFERKYLDRDEKCFNLTFQKI